MLKIDVYVKIVLTVIAVCLMVIAFRPVFSTPVEAREGRRVPRALLPYLYPEARGYLYPEAGGGVIDVNIVAIDGRKFGSLQIDSLSPALPVEIINTVDVVGEVEVTNIVGVEGQVDVSGSWVGVDVRNVCPRVQPIKVEISR